MDLQSINIVSLFSGNASIYSSTHGAMSNASHATNYRYRYTQRRRYHDFADGRDVLKHRLFYRFFEGGSDMPASPPPSDGGGSDNSNNDGFPKEKTMKRETIFNAEGFYAKVVASNAITHDEAISIGTEIVERWLKHEKIIQQSVRVLDLACGGIPKTIAGIMAAFPELRFNYHGIDINADQVRKAQRVFQYPDNVVGRRISEGDAWNLDTLRLNETHDIIFSGLNFHHGTPEELYLIALQIHDLLAPNGVLINHDIYRPSHLDFLRRPDRNLANNNESLQLIEDLKLASITMPDFGVWERRDSSSSQDWRLPFVEGLNAYLTKAGADLEGIQINAKHILNRDYPVSTDEVVRIFSEAGFDVVSHDLDHTDHPLRQYFAVIEARRRSK